jgi:hypothetical protein
MLPTYSPDGKIFTLHRYDDYRMDQAMDAMANVHPLQAIQSTIGAAGGDPRPLQRASLFNNANDGPAKIIAKVSGVQSGGIREDDGPYFTNNEGIPFPDPAHSKTIGGLPLASDTFLFQKQQHFNRSKNLESKLQPKPQRSKKVTPDRDGASVW